MECDLPMLLAPDGAETSFFPKLDEVVHQDAARLVVIAFVASLFFRAAMSSLNPAASSTSFSACASILSAGSSKPLFLHHGHRAVVRLSSSFNASTEM